MKKTTYILIFLCSLLTWGQNEQLAQNYFDKGEFDKAATLLDEIVKKQPNNTFFVQKLAASYQQLQQYSKADQLLTEKYDQYKLPSYLVELGYNYQLQKNQSKADSYYEKAFKEIEKNANYAYSIAQVFEQKNLLQWAYKSYEAGQKSNPNLNFDYQMALLQGQMGNLENMTTKLFDYAYANPNALVNVQNQLSYFLQEDTGGTFLASLKKELLLRTQKNQDIFW